MLRIIAGQFRSRSIHQPPLTITRPTKDRVREAVFSAIGTKVLHAKVLDLFAGSGAYGIEAISRGATFVHFNDQHPEATAVIQSNCHALKLTPYALTQREYQACISQLKKDAQTFDLIFIDPPYAQDLTAVMSALLQTPSLLNPQAMVVVEYEEGSSAIPEDLFQVKRYNYGRTNISIGWKKT
jgi:16S rRNA (guanine966-N2)-methyltransferase